MTRYEEQSKPLQEPLAAFERQKQIAMHLFDGRLMSPADAANRGGAVREVLGVMTTPFRRMMMAVVVTVSVLTAGTAKGQSVAPAAEQASDEVEPATSFAQLQSRVHLGDVLIVRQVDGRKTKGILAAISSSSIELRDARIPRQTSEFSEISAREIEVERRDTVVDGVLIGAVSPSAPLFLAWLVTSSDDEGSRGKVAALVGGMAAVGGLAGFFIDRAWSDKITMYEAPPASTMEQARSQLKAGDLLIVSRPGEPAIRARLASISDTHIELAVDAGRRVPIREIAEIQIERPDKWWPSAAAGAGLGVLRTHLRTYQTRCNYSSFGPQVCEDFDPPAYEYVLVGLAGASAGWAIDWLRRDRTTIYRATSLPRDARTRVSPFFSRSASGIQVRVSY
jgi:hypothetical protein